MRTITKQHTQENIYYLCDVCNKEYSFKQDALKCMRQHECEHEFKHEIEFIYGDCGCDFYIKCYCDKCGLPNPDRRELKFDIEEIPEQIIKAIYDHFNNLRRKPNDQNV